jgi:hypothetical protein
VEASLELMIHIGRHRQGHLEIASLLRECLSIQDLTFCESRLLDDDAFWLPDMKSTWELDKMRTPDDEELDMRLADSRSHRTCRPLRDLDIVAEWFAC